MCLSFQATCLIARDKIYPLSSAYGVGTPTPNESDVPCFVWPCCGCADKGNRGVLSKPAALKGWITTLSPLTPGDTGYEVAFEWDEAMGVPGAFLIENNHHFQFYLKTVTLEDVPGKGRVHFVCNSWVYPLSTYGYKRVFFSNDVSDRSRVEHLVGIA